MKYAWLLLIVLAVAVGGVSTSAAAIGYSVSPLGVASGYDGSWAMDINDDGIIMCASASITDDTGSFLWSQNGGNINLSGHGISAAAGVNSKGQTVGVYRDTASGLFRPFIRNADGTTKNLQIPIKYPDAWPVAIDDAGRVFVSLNYYVSYTADPYIKTAIIDVDGSFSVLEAPDGTFSVSAISSGGTCFIGGYLRNSAGEYRMLPWLQHSGGMQVRCVNDSGWIAAMWNGHVIRWDSEGNLADLEQGTASGMNNRGQIVGAIDGQAVIWEVNNSVTYLPTPEGYSGLNGYTINNSGQVVGEGLVNGQRMALLWTPVPEPSSFAALIAGLLPVGVTIHRRRGWQR